MAKSRSRYPQSRKVFGILFVVFACLFLIVSQTPIQKKTTSGGTVVGLSGALAWVSLLTSLASLVGLVSTTVLGWRKERREAREAELERQRRALELEKLELEIDKMKAGKRGGESE